MLQPAPPGRQSADENRRMGSATGGGSAGDAPNGVPHGGMVR